MKRSIEDMHIAGYYSNAIMRCFAFSYCTGYDGREGPAGRRAPASVRARYWYARADIRETCERRLAIAIRGSGEPEGLSLSQPIQGQINPLDQRLRGHMRRLASAHNRLNDVGG